MNMTISEHIKDLCRIGGIIEGVIKTAPNSNQDEEDNVAKLIRANIKIRQAIEEIENFKEVK